MLYAFNMRLPFGTLQAVVLYIGLRLVSHLTREYVNPHKSFLIFKLTGRILGLLTGFRSTGTACT